MSLSFDRRTWPSFYALLRFHAQAQGLWDQIDPDVSIANDNAPENALAKPPTLELIVAEENKQRATAYETAYAEWETAQDPERGPPPDAPTLATSRDKTLKERFEEHRKDYPSKAAHYTYKTKAFNALNQWIEAHVEKPLLIAAMQIAGKESGQSTRTLVRTLRDLVAPTQASTEASIRDKYQDILRRARMQGTGIHTWFQRFQEAFLNAKAYGLREVLDEPQASQEFLYAVGTRYQPAWARGQIDEMMKNDALGIPQHLQLNDYIRWFGALISSLQASEHHFGTYATLGGRGSNDPLEAQDCPCGPTPTHKWGPERCLYVEYALKKTIKEDFSRGRFQAPSETRIQQILERLQEPKWSALYTKLGGGGNQETPSYPGSIRG